MKSTLPNSFNLIMNSLVEYSQVECVCPQINKKNLDWYVKMFHMEDFLNGIIFLASDADLEKKILYIEELWFWNW